MTTRASNTGIDRKRLDRREFFGRGAAAGVALALGPMLASAGEQAASTNSARASDRRIKLGLVGCGGRGSWITQFFTGHGGYTFVSVADYFQDRAEQAGAALGLDKSKCFSGLSGYKRVVESGAEAVVLETPSFFFPEHVEAAVAAGLHVYMAKPVAVDVPGTLRIGAAGQAATKKNRVLLVDYQIPTDPENSEVVKRIREGGLGALQAVWSYGYAGGDGFNDPPLTANIESRLTGLVWVNDDALGGGYIVNFDVHIVDAVVWALGRRAVAAYGKGGRFRREPNGDSFDTNIVTYTFEDGLAWTHQSGAGPTHDWLQHAGTSGLVASIQGSKAAARLSYWDKAYLRGGPKHYGGKAVEGLYDAGARRNVATFHELIASNTCSNDTVARAVDGTLTCILGREAARRGCFLSMNDLIKENKALAVDLRGLKA